MNKALEEKAVANDVDQVDQQNDAPSIEVELIELADLRPAEIAAIENETQEAIESVETKQREERSPTHLRPKRSFAEGARAKIGTLAIAASAALAATTAYPKDAEALPPFKGVEAEIKASYIVGTEDRRRWGINGLFNGTSWTHKDPMRGYLGLSYTITPTDWVTIQASAAPGVRAGGFKGVGGAGVEFAPGPVSVGARIDVFVDIKGGYEIDPKASVFASALTPNKSGIYFGGTLQGRQGTFVSLLATGPELDGVVNVASCGEHSTAHLITGSLKLNYIHDFRFFGPAFYLGVGLSYTGGQGIPCGNLRTVGQ